MHNVLNSMHISFDESMKMHDETDINGHSNDFNKSQVLMI